MDNALFYESGSLSQYFEHLKQQMHGCIQSLAAARINGATDEEIAEHFISQYTVAPIVFYPDQAVADNFETMVDISKDPGRCFLFTREGPILVQGLEIRIAVPYSGDPVLFDYQPSHFNFNPPHGRVEKKGELAGTVSMTMSLPADSATEAVFNGWIQKQLDSLGQYAEWMAKDVEAYNKGLPALARDAVLARRQQLEKQGALLQKLVIPLRSRPGAPSPTPIPMPKRVVKPLPAPRAVEQEYGISEADYEYILKIIRQESRSFESTPVTFGKLSEEELRDVVLAHLNGHFNGDATGERFRKRGKTDICIEYDNRAAFVAECKLWKGPKVLLGAIDQLLSYLTWRDTRTALVIWNIANKDFSKLQGEMPDLLKSHPRFVRAMEAGQAGEWRAAFRAVGDDGREVIVHVFLVDLHVSAGEEACRPARAEKGPDAEAAGGENTTK